jgi:hypothetical protein
VPLRTFPRLSWWAYRKSLRSLVTVDVLNYVDYVKRDAKARLERELGWRDYGGKHFESIYTRFYQGCMLPRKFGYDKRKTHLSSLVCAGQIGRDEALAQLAGGPYPPEAGGRTVHVLRSWGSPRRSSRDPPPKRSCWDYPSCRRVYKHPLVKRPKPSTRPGFALTLRVAILEVDPDNLSATGIRGRARRLHSGRRAIG